MELEHDSFWKGKIMRHSSEAPTYRWLRVGLAILALAAAVVGCWAFFAPVSFFANFPLPGHSWVALLPPYNEHLVRDVGEFNMSFAFLFVWAAISCERRLVQAILVAWLVYAVPHFIFHLAHLAHFPLVDQITLMISLGIVLLLPLVLLINLWYSKRQYTSTARPSGRMDGSPPKMFDTIE